MAKMPKRGVAVIITEGYYRCVRKRLATLLSKPTRGVACPFFKGPDKGGRLREAKLLG
jgi:hypothetical protein